MASVSLSADSCIKPPLSVSKPRGALSGQTKSPKGHRRGGCIPIADVLRRSPADGLALPAGRAVASPGPHTVWGVVLGRVLVGQHLFRLVASVRAGEDRDETARAWGRSPLDLARDSDALSPGPDPSSGSRRGGPGPAGRRLAPSSRLGVI